MQYACAYQHQAIYPYTMQNAVSCCVLLLWWETKMAPLSIMHYRVGCCFLLLLLWWSLDDHSRDRPSWHELRIWLWLPTISLKHISWHFVSLESRDTEHVSSYTTPMGHTQTTKNNNSSPCALVRAKIHFPMLPVHGYRMATWLWYHLVCVLRFVCV